MAAKEDTVFCSYLDGDGKTFITVPIPELAGQHLISVGNDYNYEYSDLNSCVTQLVTDQGNMYYVGTTPTKILTKPALVNVAGTMPPVKIVKVVFAGDGEYVLDNNGNLYHRAGKAKVYEKFVLPYPVVSLAKILDDSPIIKLDTLKGSIIKVFEEGNPHETMFHFNNIHGYKFVEDNLSHVHCRLYKDDKIIDLDLIGKMAHKDLDEELETYEAPGKIIEIDYEQEGDDYMVTTSNGKFDTEDFIDYKKTDKDVIFSKTINNTTISIIKDNTFIDFLSQEDPKLEKIQLEMETKFKKGFFGNLRVIFWTK